MSRHVGRAILSRSRFAISHVPSRSQIPPFVLNKPKRSPPTIGRTFRSFATKIEDAQIDDEIDDEKLKEAFDRIDVDGSGSITKDNLEEVLGGLDGWVRDDAKVEAMIKKADEDGDGKVSWEEFKSMVSSDASSSPDAASSSSSSSSSSSFSFDPSSFIPNGYQVRQGLLNFSDGVKETWQELINPDRSSNFKKQIAAPMSKEESAERVDEHGSYTGPSEIMAVEGEKDAWERMRARMASAPIIEDVLKAAGKVYSSDGVKATRERLGDIKEDAREAWETSQNPWVYRISSIIDTFSAEDEFAVAVRELRRLDPGFDMEEWRYALGESFVIPFIENYMKSDLKALKPWMHGEGMKRKIEGEIRTRKQEGVRFDENVTSTEPEHLEVIAAQLDPNDRGSPIILVQFILQQINCIYSLKDTSEDFPDGKIIQGSPDEIRQNVYLMGFQRVFEEETGELVWKVVDLQLHMGEKYI